MKTKIKYNTKTTITLWILQLIVAAIFLNAAYTKLFAMNTAVQIFDLLTLGSQGRIFIGLLELLSAILLISWRFAASGAVLGFAVMIGALIAHATVLGLNTVLMAVVVMAVCAVIIVKRKKEVPLIGDQL